MEKCCNSHKCIGSFSRGNFPPNDLKGLQRKLLALAGTKTGMIKPGTSGNSYLTFHLEGTDGYIALNAHWEAVRFFAEKVERFCGVVEGPQGGKILGLRGVKDYPLGYCIYHQYAQRKR